MKRTISKCGTLLILTALFALAHPASAQEEDGIFGLKPKLIVQGGGTGSYWAPRGIEPYEVDTYGRQQVYGEIKLLHPLLILSEAFDIVQVPSLRIETNLGYSSGSETFRDLLPDAVIDNPYLRTTSWLTFFRFVTLRYRNERFNALISDPRAFSVGYTGPLSYDFAIRLQDLEVGLIGSPDGRLRETMIEFGFYRSWLTRPILGPYVDEDQNGVIDGVPALLIHEGRYDGFYMGLVTEPTEEWPLRSMLLARFGGMFGLDMRLAFDRKVHAGLRAGVEAEVSWRFYQYSYDEYGRIDNLDDTNKSRETRMRATFYVRYKVF